MSGQSPLFRIAMTCAAIVIGSAVVGSQLATTGPLSRVASSVSDEEDDMAEEGAYADPAGVSDRIEDESGGDAEAHDEDVAEDSTEDAAENLEEDASEDSAKAASEDPSEGIAEDEAGDSAEEVSIDPAEEEASDSAEGESSAASDGEPKDEGGTVIVRRKP